MTAVDDPPSVRATYDPDQRYVAGARPVLLTGVQAVARLLVEQHARDARLGRRTASLVSGYPGSPLGGLDRLLHSLPQLRTEAGVHLVPGVNEELGATAVWGSQGIPGRQRYDGVVGVWYGKGPGVDRAGDALRHGNTYGASADGGVLVLAGDDPAAKSSSVPCTSERSLASFGMPVLTPRNAEELIAFGLYGVALSRLSGCWVGIKVLADVADGLWTVDRDFPAVDITVPAVEWQGRSWTYRQFAMRDPRESVAAEAQLLGPRWAAVEAFGAANAIDEIEVDPANAWLGIASTGLAHDATRQALLDLGLDEVAMHHHGIRLLRVGMPYPLGAEVTTRFARGLRQVLVIEEKTSFLEAQLKEILYGGPDTPAVFGKRDLDGRLLVPADGQLTAERVELVLRRVLHGRVELRDPQPAPRTALTLTAVPRTPYFCSGCPHNRSTIVPEGSLAGGGIGCHALVVVNDRDVSSTLGLTQMGGEGTQWIGQTPFTDVDHIFQNLGDGTYAHSGQLSVQACIAAGVNITFKILYNSVVAMTGAQEAEGGLSVRALTRKLAAEGVRRPVVVTDEPHKYRRRHGLARGTSVRHRDDLDAVQRELRNVPGVTVIIYDQQCANEARRLRKRGNQQVRPTRVIIDEAVCEGCGDCGTKSNCLSVQPAQTELGRKTRIDQTSCNTDYSCLAGDCPSFLTVTVSGAGRNGRRRLPDLPALPPPSERREAEVFLTGIGGTGIVTVNHVLGTAALRSGLTTTGLDQVGLSQKAGPVASHLRLGGARATNRVSHAGADALLAFDLLVAADPKNLAMCAKERTIAVVSTSATPTGSQVSDVTAPATDTARLLARVAESVACVFEIDALGAAEALFGSTTPANFLLVGAAYQLGLLPMPATAVEEALALNGVAVAANVAAFRWGRTAVADPATFAGALRPHAPPTRPVPDLPGGSPLAGETRRAAAIRAELLRQHSGRRAVASYLAVVERAWRAERELGSRTDYSEAVARGVAHLMAYKDEYEVARLLTRPELLEQVQRDVPGASKLSYNLHPPALRAMGMNRKIRLPARTSRPLLLALAQGRRLRGTPFDPFGRAKVRKLERDLMHEHKETVERLTAALTESSYDASVTAAAAAELVRGYEDVKLRSFARYREQVAASGVGS